MPTHGDCYCSICGLPIDIGFYFNHREYDENGVGITITYDFRNEEKYQWMMNDTGCCLNNDVCHLAKSGGYLASRLECNICVDKKNRSIYHGLNDLWYVLHRYCYHKACEVVERKILPSFDYGLDEEYLTYKYGCKIARINKLLYDRPYSSAASDLNEEFKKDNIVSTYTKYHTICDQQNQVMQFFELNRMCYLEDPKFNEFSKKRFISKFSKIFSKINFT